MYMSRAIDGSVQFYKIAQAIDGSMCSCAIHRYFTKMGHYPKYP